MELAVDLLLADPRPPPDAEQEDGGSDTGVIWTRKVLEDRKKSRRKFPPFLLMTPQSENPEREARKGSIWGWREGRRKEREGPCWFWQKDKKK